MADNNFHRLMFVQFADYGGHSLENDSFVQLCFQKS